MFSFLITRSGPIHIITYQSSNGKYNTVCAKRFSAQNCINILAADNTFPGICNTCKEYYDARYFNALKYQPSLVRNEDFHKFYDLADYHRYNVIGPQIKYTDAFDRYWSRLNRYKKLIKKK